MPTGDAERIHCYVGQRVEDARAKGETTLAIRVGDVRDGMGLNYSDAIIDICQVLETQKFEDEACVKFLDRTGPRQGANTVFRFEIHCLAPPPPPAPY